MCTCKVGIQRGMCLSLMDLITSRGQRWGPNVQFDPHNNYSSYDNIQV